MQKLLIKRMQKSRYELGMLTSKGVVKLVFVAVAICAVVIGAIILILNSMPVENPILQEQTRENAA